MGKRVFEIAKELGVDHRDALKKCDELAIDARNYMSVLSNADESKLRAAYTAERQQGPVEVRQAPGVVRRRPPRARDSAATPRPVPKPAPSVARATPAAAQSAPQQAAPVTPAPEAKAPEPPKAPAPAPETPPPAEQRVEAAAPPAPAEAAPAPAPKEPEAPRAPEAERPAAPVEVPAAAARPAEAAKAPEAEAPRPKAPEPKPPEPQAPAERAPESARVVETPPRVEPARRPEAERHPAAEAERRPEAERRAMPQRPPERREPRTEEVARGVTRRTGTPVQPTEDAARKATEVRKPGQAKILGTIPLEQLRARTQRPTRRPGARPGDMRGPGGDARGPGGPGPGGGPGGARPRPGGPGPRPGMGDRGGPGAGPRRPGSMNFGPPMPPPAADKGDRRRRGPPPAQRTDHTRRPRSESGGGGAGAGAGGAAGKKRRVFNREDLYKSAGGRTRAGRKRKMASRRGAKTQLTTPAAHKRVVRIDDTISVGQLGQEMGVKASELIRKLMQMGVMATVNQQIDVDTAALLATDYDYEVKNVAFQEDEVLSGPVDEATLEKDPDALPRAPVVTIMGHVDHGKTTLLDTIRKANVAKGEAGGITQHIGAYRVPVGESAVVFLDTPGHAAFTAMRARGASVTDVVVLVVAADDGVMPQTVESINHARAAGVPLIVAVNKMDKPGADPERIKQELTKYELVPEEWGGDTMYVPVSALKGTGVDSLLEALALQSEVLELKSNPKKPAFGTVVEARVDKGRGNVVTVLVQEGTLRRGDFIVSGENFGRVRAMIDDRGKQVKEAGPSTPVEVLGLGGLPAAGDTFHVAESEKEAKKVATVRTDKARAADAEARHASRVTDFMGAMGKPQKEIQNIILKTDVSGSLEAIRTSLQQLATDEVEVKIVHSAVGAINESDVTLAQASDAIIVGFNVSPDTNAKRAADQGDVKVLKFEVIYDVIDAVKDLLSGLLTPETVEETLGHAEVRAVFHVQRVGKIAGCFVQDGKVLRNAMGRVHRNGSLVATGKISTLKRFKDDVREVASGYECGLSIDGYKDVQEGDVIEVYDLKQVQRQIA